MRTYVTIALLLGAVQVSRAKDTQPAHVDYDRDVRPILARSCFECHGPDDAPRQAGLRLDQHDGAIAVLDSGAQAIFPGDADSSELIVRVASPDQALHMPPPQTTPSLSDQEVAVLRRWIDEGAEYTEHWSYIAPRRPSLPSVSRTDWPRNEIDYFVLARLEQEGLQPAAPAEKAHLLRRVYLDLIGLPPTVEDVDRFLADRQTDAYERVVEKLLASPRYGERWAGPWLDLARHADSNGYQRDGFRDVWAYRDWVIDAMNRDMPFDRFTIEQLAGDLLPAATWRQQVATGFHRSTTVSVEAGTDQEEDRVNAIIDRVNTTATIWLGSTVACAQCHHHKYDAWRQEDYYRLFAYFNATPLETKDYGSARREFVGPQINLPEPPARRWWRELLEDALLHRKSQLDQAIKNAAAQQREWEESAPSETAVATHNELPAAIAGILRMSSKDRNDSQRNELREYFLSHHTEVSSLRGSIELLESHLARLQPATALVMQDMNEVRATHVLERGDFLSPQKAVEAGVPTFLHAAPDNAPSSRLGLARWLVDTKNPLVGRVTVNRWWSEFFGRGLVSTPEDFGTQGARPTHPELLDWLAVQFVEYGWSRKSIHRLIVNSSTYRQSSHITPELHRRDPSNELLARGPRVRLAAEAIRDNALAISGLLSTKMGGPPVRPWQPDGIWRVTGKVDNTYQVSQNDDRYRRGVYVVWRRSSPYPSFVNFDAPDRTACVVERPRTNTPLQALTLMNDPVYVEAAMYLAARILRDRPGASLSERTEYAFRLSLARSPDDEERDLLVQVAKTESERYLHDSPAAERLVKPYATLRDLPAAELAAWFQVATILLNLDETITKG